MRSWYRWYDYKKSRMKRRQLRHPLLRCPCMSRHLKQTLNVCAFRCHIKKEKAPSKVYFCRCNTLVSKFLSTNSHSMNSCNRNRPGPIRSFVSVFFTIPIDRYLTTSFAIWGQFAHCFITLTKLATLDIDGWDWKACHLDFVKIVDEATLYYDRAGQSSPDGLTVVKDSFLKWASRLRWLKQLYESRSTDSRPEESEREAAANLQSTKTAGYEQNSMEGAQQPTPPDDWLPNSDFFSGLDDNFWKKSGHPVALCTYPAHVSLWTRLRAAASLRMIATLGQVTRLSPLSSWKSPRGHYLKRESLEETFLERNERWPTSPSCKPAWPAVLVANTPAGNTDALGNIEAGLGDGHVGIWGCTSDVQLRDSNLGRGSCEGLKSALNTGRRAEAGGRQITPLLDLVDKASELGVGSHVEVVVVDVQLSAIERISTGSTYRLAGSLEGNADKVLTEHPRKYAVPQGTILGEDLVDNIIGVDLALVMSHNTGNVVLDHGRKGVTVVDVLDPSRKLRVPEQLGQLVGAAEGKASPVWLSGIPLPGVFGRQLTKVGFDDVGVLGVGQGARVGDRAPVFLALGLEGGVNRACGSLSSLIGRWQCCRQAKKRGQSKKLHLELDIQLNSLLCGSVCFDRLLNSGVHSLMMQQAEQANALGAMTINVIPVRVYWSQGDRVALHRTAEDIANEPAMANCPSFIRKTRIEA
ncbi:Endo-1,4-beta-xylanase [Hortaea werneckii]|nr:Endo-1,4-beta-xylanase [Hortaea werneckii]